MKQPTPFAIHVHGGRPHQRGYAYFGDARPSRFTPGLRSDEENLNGPVVVLVRNGKPLNARGRELLRKPS